MGGHGSEKVNSLVADLCVQGADLGVHLGIKVPEVPADFLADAGRRAQRGALESKRGRLLQ